jgi:outer membrane protein assembly factor BamB
VDLAFGQDGNVYVSSLDTHQVLRYNGKTGAFIDAFVSAGSGGLKYPEGVLFGSDGKLYVSSNGTDQVLRYNGKTGAFIDAFVAAGSGGLSGPSFLTRLPLISGCVRQEGVPVVGAKVTVSNQTTTKVGRTGVGGCYAFKSGGLTNKNNKLTIYLPPAP